MFHRIGLSMALASTLFFTAGCGDEDAPQPNAKNPPKNTSPTGDDEPSQTTPGEANGNQSSQGATGTPQQQPQEGTNQNNPQDKQKRTGNNAEKPVPVPADHPDVKKANDSE